MWLCGLSPFVFDMFVAKLVIMFCNYDVHVHAIAVGVVVVVCLFACLILLVCLLFHTLVVNW